MGTRLRSDAMVKQLFGPTMRDAAVVRAKTGRAVGFYSIAAYEDGAVPGWTDAYRRGVKTLVAQSSGNIALHGLNVGAEGVAPAIRRYDVRQSGQHGGMIFIDSSPGAKGRR